MISPKTKAKPRRSHQLTRMPQYQRMNPVYVGLAEGFHISERVKMSEWVEDNIVLSPERSSSPGPFTIGDAVYQKEMFDACTDPDIDEVVFVTSSQVGKTSILTAVQAYYSIEEPCPQLTVFPNQIVADGYVEEQLEPTIRDSPNWRDVMDGLSYAGGYIAAVGANNPSQLARRPIRVVTGDEIDRWPLSAGKEGSPMDLFSRRQVTFPNRKTIVASTPVHSKTSISVSRFNTCMKLYYHVVCEDCGEEQVLDFVNVRYDKGKEEKAAYVCPHCGVLWDERKKRRLIRESVKRGGGWKTAKVAPYKCFDTKDKPVPGRVGFWVNELYSPWVTMREMAQAWSDAEGNPSKEQVFRNTREGLPWEGSVSNQADPEMLKARREVYSSRIVPREAGMVTAGVDVQDDRIEILVVAWGYQDESWLLERIVLRHDPSQPATWDLLAETLNRRYPHEAGKRVLRIECAAIDSGGHFTQSVYKFVNKHGKMGRRWHAIKGVAGEGRPLFSLSKEKNKNVAKLWLVGVDDGKTLLYTRYAVTTPGPGYIHINESFDDAAIEQLTAEHALEDYDKQGFPHRIWEVKKRGMRNEMFDCLVYATAAREDINIDMVQRLLALNDMQEDTLTAAQVGALYK